MDEIQRLREQQRLQYLAQMYNRERQLEQFRQNINVNPLGLPDNVMVLVFSFLRVPEIVHSISLVCCDWNRIIASGTVELWKPLYERIFWGSAVIGKLNRDSPTYWKDAFIARGRIYMRWRDGSSQHYLLTHMGIVPVASGFLASKGRGSRGHMHTNKTTTTTNNSLPVLAVMIRGNNIAASYNYSSMINVWSMSAPSPPLVLGSPNNNNNNNSRNNQLGTVNCFDMDDYVLAAGYTHAYSSNGFANTLCVWNLFTGVRLKAAGKSELGDTLLSVKTRSRKVACGYPQRLMLYDIQRGSFVDDGGIDTAGHQPDHIHMLDDNIVMAVMQGSPKVRVYDLRACKLTHTFTNPGPVFLCEAACGDTTTVTSSSSNNNSSNSSTLNPASVSVVSAYTDANLRTRACLWDIRSTDRPRKKLKDPEANIISLVMDEREIAFGLQNNSVMLYDTKSGKRLKGLYQQISRGAGGIGYRYNYNYGNGIQYLCMDRRKIVGCDQFNSHVTVWDRESGNVISAPTPTLMMSGDEAGYITHLAMDEARLVAVDNMYNIHVHNYGNLMHWESLRGGRRLCD